MCMDTEHECGRLVKNADWQVLEFGSGLHVTHSQHVAVTGRVSVHHVIHSSILEPASLYFPLTHVGLYPYLLDVSSFE